MKKSIITEDGDVVIRDIDSHIIPFEKDAVQGYLNREKKEWELVAADKTISPYEKDYAVARMDAISELLYKLALKE